jgi:hypothetical protein
MTLHVSSFDWVISWNVKDGVNSDLRLSIVFIIKISSANTYLEIIFKTAWLPYHQSSENRNYFKKFPLELRNLSPL